MQRIKYAYCASVITACFSLFFSTSSAAGATAKVVLDSGPGQRFSDYVGITGPMLITAQTSGTSGDSSGSAYADLSSGVLKSFANATNAYPGTPYGASAVSAATDIVRFSGGVGQTAYLDWSFDGSLSYTRIETFAFGRMLVYTGGSTTDITLAAYFGSCSVGSTFSDCTVGTSVNKQGSIPFVITAFEVDSGIQLGASLNAFSTFGNTAAFSNTGKLYLRAPEGVTFTSSTGSFLTNAAPIFAVPVPVPEPQTYVMLLAGLGAVAVRRRRSATPTP